MFKIVFSDIDGTLLNAERDLSESTVETIAKLSKKDIPFILISSRMPAAMRHLQKKMNIEHLPLISYNGGLILVDDKKVSSTEIPIEQLEALHKFNQQDDVHLSLFHNDEWYVPRHDFWTSREINNTKVNPALLSNEQVIKNWQAENKGAHKIMAMGAEEKIDRIRDFLSENFGNDLHLYRSKPSYLEIAPMAISKLSAIEYLLKNHYNFPLSQSMAFGDNYNDVEMIRGVGMGIAVANAKPEVLEIAHMVTTSGKEDGVAKGIIEILKI